MAQNDIQISTTPPLSGTALVNQANDAFVALGTDFAGAVDPITYAGVGPYSTWADTANGIVKRRNAANTAWVNEYLLLTNNNAAVNQTYDNSTSGLTATNVQAAIDELDEGRLLGVQRFTSSGTYTPTAGVSKIVLQLKGGGGGGGGASNVGSGVSAGGGGGEGAEALVLIDRTDFGSTVAVTIGAGGLAGIASSAAVGGAGGATVFGALVSAAGGNGGAGTDRTTSVSRGGPGGEGGSAVTVTTGTLIWRKLGAAGGAGLRLADNGISGTGGGGTRSVFEGAPGNTGTDSGFGGSGGCENSTGGRAGGAGAPGVLVVWEYA